MIVDIVGSGWTHVAVVNAYYLASLCICRPGVLACGDGALVSTFFRP